MSTENDKRANRHQESAAEKRKRLHLQRLRLKYAKEVGAVRFKALEPSAQGVIFDLADCDFQLALLRQRSIAGEDAGSGEFVRLANAKRRLLREMERLKTHVARAAKPSLDQYLANKGIEGAPTA